MNDGNRNDRYFIGEMCVTPEMTEAGAELIRSYFYDVQADVTDRLRELAFEVFEAMIRQSGEGETISKDSNDSAH